MSSDPLRDLLADRHLAVLATIRRDGRPQLSTVVYVYDRDRDLVQVSITDDRAKTKNLRRDPRATLHVSGADGWTYVVAECRAEVGPVATEPDDEAVEELVDIYRRASGEHPDWADYRRAMVAERRVPLRLFVERLLGTAG
ncbi:PPOX class probable F420-dependent enzyme [Barrientosiimonas humi]|uniref:PPOX class probable F420-dependent enzyme n=1 Tax=Barrientosiimonas humi TaxID=999931 RepID=A0A542XF86_9MICO|nr:PPOX class F420-dependent oxidoreductase [Barrientosiimonas humi]TQL34478.1 PPOX class probable F420-dependent enzyme [Barrientosiimonas humi]CAG7574467.1 Putative pyridoxine/pyridoxamine 5'-phosphate oxidase [Barrientosiimonas humi]